MTTGMGTWAANKKVQDIARRALNGGAMSAFFGFWNGRCTFFAIAFSIVGLYGWLVLGRDLTSFALFAGAMQALLIAHSTKEDYFQGQQQQQSTQVVNNITVDPDAVHPPANS
jgi:hypothetical protein